MMNNLQENTQFHAKDKCFLCFMFESTKLFMPFMPPSHPVGKLHVWPATGQDDLDIFGRKIGKPMSIA
jgi:hypothetical protein